jgi:hypothetical protein
MGIWVWLDCALAMLICFFFLVGWQWTLTHFVFSGGLMTLVTRQHSPSSEKVVLLSFHPSSFVASGHA